MSRIACNADLQEQAKRRVPRMFYDYADSGAYTEGTYQDNTSAFDKYKLRQRVAVSIDNRSVATKMIGQDVSMPVALAPIGLLGMQHADGEILAAKAAEKFGIPFTLSTMSICSIEAVAEATSKPFWFQLYVMRDRGFIEALIKRAHTAGCDALVLTLDLQILGQRHKDVRNGLTAPPSPSIRNLINLATKPRWCMGMLGRWDRKLILKGINDVEDAKIAADIGADAIVVSNHGGRQLDGAAASIDMLGRIVDAVGDRVEVHFDSGIRNGQDVFKAIAMGAKGTFIGRSFVYGLGANGEAGVTKALEMMQKELDITMALCGESNINDVGLQNLLDYDSQTNR